MYLLSEAMRVKNQRLCRQSFVIDQEKIAYVRERMPYWKKRKVCMTNTVIAPSKIGYCKEILNCQTKQKLQAMEMEWLRQGVTTLAVLAEVKSERTLIKDVEASHLKLKELSLDYVLGISIPLEQFKPSIFRLCRKLRIPMIQVHIPSFTSLLSLPWSYYADAALTYPSVLLPKVDNDTTGQTYKMWEQQCEWFGLSTATITPLLTKELMQKSGLFPEKGELFVGSDADYLLYKNVGSYQLTRQARKLATNSNLDYDKGEPDIVVQRGNMLKANQSFVLDEGGRSIQVKKPKRLLSMEYAPSIDERHLQVDHAF